MARKAVHGGKTELAEFLRTPLGRARARAIHHLAAGNHRTYVVLSDFLDKDSLEDLVGPFMQMIDDLTPYYQDRMRVLPPAQRKIVEFLCLKARPTTIKDIATPCLMSHQSTAKQIGELETSGLVSRMRFGRNTFCEISEPLMRICMEVKDNETRHFRLFVEFLRHWFTTRKPERQHAAFQHNDVDHVHGRAAQPLSTALDMLGSVLEHEDFEGQHLEATVGILTVSVRTFGPRSLPEGLAKLRGLLKERADRDAVGRILTGFLKANIDDGFAGPLADWEVALESLTSSLADLPDCRIPLEMLRAAVTYTRSGDERHLLSLPLEQRQLLEDIPLAASGERDARLRTGSPGRQASSLPAQA